MDIAQILIWRVSGNPSGMSVSVGWQWASTTWAKTDGGGNSMRADGDSIDIDHAAQVTRSLLDHFRYVG